MIVLLLALAQQATAPAAVTTAAPAAPAAAAADDIVVVARRQKCRVKFADRDMDDAEFKRRAAEWAAGRPVRVIARANADIKCLSKIAFRLADRGVRRISFVEPGDLAPAAGPPVRPR